VAIIRNIKDPALYEKYKGKTLFFHWIRVPSLWTRAGEQVQISNRFGNQKLWRGLSI